MNNFNYLDSIYNKKAKSNNLTLLTDYDGKIDSGSIA